MGSILGLAQRCVLLCTSPLVGSCVLIYCVVGGHVLLPAFGVVLLLVVCSCGIFSGYVVRCIACKWCNLAGCGFDTWISATLRVPWPPEGPVHVVRCATYFALTHCKST